MESVKNDLEPSHDQISFLLVQVGNLWHFVTKDLSFY
jgi:hypothetical protein